MIEGKKITGKQQRLRCGMIGGGRGAFIGDVHRKALAMDGKAELVAGCFSSSIENTRETGELLGLDPERLYPSFSEMLDAEAKRPDRCDFVIIVTPNDTHYAIARAALDMGFHVVCDKPLATNSRDAETLSRLALQKERLFCVTYTYTGYPMVKHARDMIAAGELGAIRFVSAEYPQDWLATSLEKTGQKQAAWRTDPNRAGVSNCVGDIGSHIENMVAYMTGLEIETLCARLDRFGEGRTLDDNASIMLDYVGGARGLYWSSQIAVGNDNGFRVRIFGTRASIEWAQEYPNYLRIGHVDRPTEILSRGRDAMAPRARELSRLPSGHPEGYFEAFANIYRTYADALARKTDGEPLSAGDLDFPDAADGARGVHFIERCVESSERGAAWLKF